MSVLNNYTGEGRISAKTFREVDRPNGRMQICQLTVPVNIYERGRDGEAKEETLWFELTAFGFPDNKRSEDEFNRAEHWNRKFNERDTVHIEGNPSPRLYQKGNGDPGFALRLNNPTVDWVLGYRPDRSDEAVAPVAVAAPLDGMPF